MSQTTYCSPIMKAKDEELSFDDSYKNGKIIRQGIKRSHSSAHLPPMYRANSKKPLTILERSVVQTSRLKNIEKYIPAVVMPVCEPKIRCIYCKFETTDRKEVVYHLALDHNFCNFCHRKIEATEEIIDHLRARHRQRVDIREITAKKEEKSKKGQVSTVPKCRFCSEEGLVGEKMYNHCMQVHKVCLECNESFDNEELHLRRKHKRDSRRNVHKFMYEHKCKFCLDVSIL